MKKIYQLYFKEFLYTFNMKIFKIIFIFFFISLNRVVANEPSSYGYNVPDTSINIGGYIDGVYDTKASEKFLFDDIALLTSAKKNRFTFISEVEISKLSLDGTSKGKFKGKSKLDIYLERFQLSYALSDTESLTLGRFNSDIGYWNEAPVNILQATTTKPHIFTSIFPAHTTGVMYENNLNDEDAFSVTLQYNKDVGKEHSGLRVDRHFSMAYHKDYDEFSLRGTSGFYRENRLKEEAYYFGMGSQYESDEFTLQAEYYLQKYAKIHPSYNMYTQGVWHFMEKHNAVFRLEWYDEQGLDNSLSLIGYVYRPTSNMALKGEYIHYSNHALNRFVYSFSVLF